MAQTQSLVVRDNLYGDIQIPDWLVQVVRSPEVQRLRHVRLMNTATDELPALSDIRRFTHTMGALHLSMRLCAANSVAMRLGRSREREFVLATVLHDVATPPFGHLVEYLLTLSSPEGWRHEEFVDRILQANYRLEGENHRVFFGNPLFLWQVVEDLGVNPERVRDAVCGRTLLGAALSSNVDVDNVDTAFRMAHALKLCEDSGIPARLVELVHFDDEGIFFDRRAVTLVETWRTLRQRVYETFMFNDGYLLSQLMLSTACRAAVDAGELTADHWFLTDEQLLEHLWSVKPARELVERFAASDLPTKVFFGWYAGQPDSADLREPSLLGELEDRISGLLGYRCLVHIIRDVGAFSKPLTIRLAADEHRTFGEQSNSTLVSVATLSKKRAPTRRDQRRVVSALEAAGLAADRLRAIPSSRVLGDLGEQLRLPGSA